MHRMDENRCIGQITSIDALDSNPNPKPNPNPNQNPSNEVVTSWQSAQCPGRSDAFICTDAEVRWGILSYLLHRYLHVQLTSIHCSPFSSPAPWLWNNSPPHPTDNLSSVTWFMCHVHSYLHTVMMNWNLATAGTCDFVDFQLTYAA